MLLDIIIIATIAICVITGYKKGLVEVAFRLISFIVALILSLVLYIPVSNFIIENTQIDDKIQEIILKNINQKEIKIGETNIETNNLPDIVTNYISKTVGDVANTAKNNIAEILATNISITVVKIITLLAIFIITRIILSIAKIIINTIASLPIINGANKIRRNNLWNIRRIINNIHIISNSDGNNYNNYKYRDINNYKPIKYRKNNV